MLVPLVGPTKMLRVAAIVPVVRADVLPLASMLAIVNRPPSIVTEVVPPNAPLSLKTTSAPLVELIEIGPSKVLLLLPRYVCAPAVPSKVRPVPGLPEITPVYRRLPLVVL